jgi:hypothetical protein
MLSVLHTFRRPALVLAFVGAGVAPSPAQTAPASPLPTPTAAPSPEPSPVPVVTASPSPLPQPLLLDRARVGIVPGTTVSVRVSGGAGAIDVADASPSVVEAHYDAVARQLFLTGRAPGTAIVTLTDAAGDGATLAVLVAAPAGVVPSDVTVELGGVVSPQFALAKMQSAIAAAAQLRPGSRVDVQLTQPAAALRPGDTLEASARVHVDGANTYVDVDGTTNVHLAVDTLAQLDPQILFYSDDPESLDPSADGVLYRNTLEAGKPARAYVYHVAAADATHDLYLVMRTAATAARVQLLGYAAGPSNAFAYVGHVATLQYLLARGAQESSIISLSPDQPYVQRLGFRELNAGELVAGIFDARVLDGGPVAFAVVSTSAGADPLALADGPELPGDGHGRRGEFDLTTVPPLALAYTAGAADPPPFSVGAPTIANLRDRGRPLGGDYGALREVALHVNNPGPDPANVYFYELPAGGSATTTIWFSGDPRPTEIPCVLEPNRYTIKAFALAPGETRDVTGEYMTDGTSSFPLQFGMTSTPPSPPPGPYSPDACNPRPAPSPAAVPSPSPTASP